MDLTASGFSYTVLLSSFFLLLLFHLYFVLKVLPADYLFLYSFQEFTTINLFNVKNHVRIQSKTLDNRLMQVTLELPLDCHLKK
jgi:hypothetical protein